MKKDRRVFSREFKREAVLLVLEQGYSVSQTCLAIDVGETALRRWIGQYQSERKGFTPTGPALTEEQKKIQELEKRIRDLELDKEILKKATALLMLDDQKSIR